MFRSSTRRPRRGAILLIVLAMLVLMAVLGLTFVLRSQSAATASRIAREKENKGTETQRPNGDDDAAYAMGSLLFGADDYHFGAQIPQDMSRMNQSGFRGHELARAMYGYDRTLVVDSTGNPLPGANLSLYSGLGRFTPAEGNVLVGTSTLPFTFPLSDVLNYAVQPGVGYVIDPERNTARAALNAYFAGAYKSVAAPYTYPDTKDFYLAVVDPTTGRVLQPSFYRNWTFNTGTANADLRLAPPSAVATNTDWQSAAGRLRIVRPRPEDHIWNGTTTFPYPVQNPDGSYTGDVQNIKSPLGQQRMDSIWIYPGGPIRTWNGKQYTTLVAPLILDLNGRVNLSMAGNRKEASGLHASGSGMGPHEINPARIFELNTNGWSDPTGALRDLLSGNNLNGTHTFNSSSGPMTVPSRYSLGGAVPGDRLTGSNLFPFNGGILPVNIAPNYSRVDVDGAPLGTRVNPIGSGNSPFPAFDPARYYGDAATQATELTSHPMQFGHESWGPTTATAGGRTFEPKDMRFLATRYGAPADYYTRAEVAKLLPRHLGSANYDPLGGPYNPGTNPAFNVTDRANLIRQLITTDSSHIWRPEVQIPNAAVNPAPANGFGIRLGPIDLNRNLTPYASVPLSNYTYDAVAPSAASAAAARQRFARDVLLRLAVSAGAQPSGLIDGTNIQYDAVNHYPRALTAQGSADLRILAQIAANIVDYVDDDDINTVFVWNPYASGTFFNPENGGGWTITDPKLHLVVGAELPRLVVNEANAIVSNKRNDAAMAAQPLEVRFWVELHNPLSTNPTLSQGGAARLHCRPGVTPGTTTLASEYSPYQLQVIEAAAGAVPAEVNDPGNVLGTITTVPALQIGKPGLPEYVFDPADAGKGDMTVINTTSGAPTDELFLVQPANGANGVARQNRGFYVVGPRDDFPGMDIGATIRLPDPPAAAMSPAAMIHPDAGQQANQTRLDALVAKRYAVVLRRLANPYLIPQEDPSQPSYNPYITVDVVDEIRPRDRVENFATGPRVGVTLSDDPSVGRKHPYAATFVEAQGTAANAGGPPPNTYFRINDDGDGNAATLPALELPQRWLTHLDRKMLNPVELANVSAYGPAQLTNRFYAVSQFNAHTVERLLLPSLVTGVASLQTAPTGYSGSTPNFTANYLHRSLDLLAVHPHATGVPVGGRQKGIVNLNTAWYKNVLNATLDAQPGNYFTNGDVDTIWARMNEAGAANARSQNGLAYNVTATDKPFRGLLGSLGDPNNTVLRSHNGTAPPMFYSQTPGTSDDNHAYVITDPLKKMWNSTSTVSNNFLVIMTIGFFEVRQVDNNGRVYLGQELYDQAPGDLREKYTAIIDRTGVALENGNVAQQATQKPWFTALAADVNVGDTTMKVYTNNAGQVYLDGTAINIPVGPAGPVWVGYGDATKNGGDGEQIAIGGPVAPPWANGVMTYNIPAAGRYHAAGSPISNVLLGNPGPQPGFDPSLPQYRGVVSYFTKLPPGE